ncbi:uncharacterized protein LOC131026187 [Salvia miltiorrhiza]|uniref:uncharacterized protein LOC131026187 n=1 Tax=Salvia miltiorrhiza TaxID=226208 RepID=UPI0025ACF4CA|nr:uncharacterized protein LOC131026187 [Salvia miltiorrhiza]
MDPMIDPGSSIPELIRFIKHSFRECEFDEVQNILMEREKSMKVEMEKLVRDCDELKKQVDVLERSKVYTESEKRDLEGKLQKRGEELDKMIVQTKEKFEKLSSEKHDVEEKLVRSSEKCEEMDERLVKMGKEIEELRREKLSANKIIWELKAKEIEADRVVQELKRENDEAVHTIDELRAEKMKSDKAVGVYENDLDPRILKLERSIAKMLSVNVEDLASLANSDGFAAAAIDAEVEENSQNGEVNPEEDRAIVSPKVPAISGSHTSVTQPEKTVPSSGAAENVPTEKTVSSSGAAENVVIVIDDSDSDDETSIPDTSCGQRNKDERKDSREDSVMNCSKRRKISTSATPSRCSSLSSRVKERDGACAAVGVDSTDSDDELISDAYMNNLVAKIQRIRGSKKD